jgi:2-methylcitrate dehydratase PrpD
MRPISSRVVDWIEATSPEKLSGDQVGYMRTLFLDWFSCLVHGASSDLSKKLYRLFGSRCGVQIFGGELSASCKDAAHYYATSAHVDEWDDSDFVGETHPSSTIWGALLASTC